MLPTRSHDSLRSLFTEHLQVLAKFIESIHFILFFLISLIIRQIPLGFHTPVSHSNCLTSKSEERKLPTTKLITKLKVAKSINADANKTGRAFSSARFTKSSICWLCFSNFAAVPRNGLKYPKRSPQIFHHGYYRGMSTGYFSRVWGRGTFTVVSSFFGLVFWT